MCCCDTPNINGTLGYKWQPNHEASIRPIDPPAISEYDKLVYDGPGRCGLGTDSHCHHYRIVSTAGGSLRLLYKHGTGQGQLHLSCSTALRLIFAAVDSEAQYWLMNSLYHAYSNGQQQGAETVQAVWRKAAAEKRIKTRKMPRNGVKVWIEPLLSVPR